MVDLFYLHRGASAKSQEKRISEKAKTNNHYIIQTLLQIIFSISFKVNTLKSDLLILSNNIVFM